ncbi:MAG: hypothetical protein ACAI38_12340 [Myxococcota bacterium]
MGRRCLVAIAFLSIVACRRAQNHDSSPFTAPEIGISLPHLPGWERDPTVKLEDPAKGGLVMRLTREERVPGMPRIDVIIDPVPVKPTFLEDVLSRALRDMADYEQRGEIDIQALDRKPIRVGPRRGFRVTHSYVVASDEDRAMVTQTSALFVLDGRGITVTATGRAELYTPLVEEVDQIVSGMNVALTGPLGASGLTKPVDLTPRPN